jgi:hypothetical protein
MKNAFKTKDGVCFSVTTEKQFCIKDGELISGISIIRRPYEELKQMIQHFRSQLNTEHAQQIAPAPNVNQESTGPSFLPSSLPFNTSVSSSGAICEFESKKDVNTNGGTNDSLVINASISNCVAEQVEFEQNLVTLLETSTPSISSILSDLEGASFLANDFLERTAAQDDGDTLANCRASPSVFDLENGLASPLPFYDWKQ